MKLGDKEVDFNPDFKFYITTKLSNPHYTPEISTKTAIVNFAVKEQGLEAQVLGNVVRRERPDLEESKDKLVVNIAEGKRKLAELEDEILRSAPNSSWRVPLCGGGCMYTLLGALWHWWSVAVHSTHPSPSPSPSPLSLVQTTKHSPGVPAGRRGAGQHPPEQQDHLRGGHRATGDQCADRG